LQIRDIRNFKHSLLNRTQQYICFDFSLYAVLSGTCVCLHIRLR